MLLMFRTTFLLLREFLLLLLQFPVWWYGLAAGRMLRLLHRSVTSDRRLLQFRLLLRHLFDPLFGGNGTREMHLMSIMIRIPLTMGAGLLVLANAFGTAFLFVLWLFLPVVAAAGFLWQVSLLPLQLFF